MNFLLELDKVLAENRALVGDACNETPEFRDTSDGIQADHSLVDWYNRSTYGRHQSKSGDDESKNIGQTTNAAVNWHELSIRASNPNISALSLSRLNDSLMGSGLPSVSREAGADDVVGVCVEALNELASRNEKLAKCVTSLQSEVKRNQQVRPPPILRVEPAMSVAESTSSEENDRLKNELERIRKLCKSNGQRADHLEHQLKAREAELSRITDRLQQRVKEEDRRSALTMSSIRGNKVGTAQFIVMNNYQRQIDELVRDNEMLRRKCQSLTVRFRHQEEPAGDLRREVEDLNDASHKLTRAIEEKDETIQALRTEVRSKEAIMYELKDEVAFLRKEALKAEHIEKEYKSLSGGVSMNDARDRLRLLASVEQLMGADLLERARVLIELERAVEISTIGSEDSLSKFHNMRARLESFENSQDPDINSLLAITGLRDKGRLVSTVQSLQFRCEELQNFYNTLVASMRLRRGCSIAECLRQVNLLIAKPVEAEHPFKFFPKEDSEGEASVVSNLAFSREIIGIPIHRSS